jgi:GT2 family glycosyltransferase
MSQPKIVAVVSTYRRHSELERLIKSLLDTSNLPVSYIVVNDDASDNEVAALVSSLPVKTRYISRPPHKCNSAASGWNRALEEAVRSFGKEATHYLLIDDDAVVETNTLAALYAAQVVTGAKSSFPAALNPAGEFYVTGQLIDPHWEDAQQRCKSREDLQREFSNNLPEAMMFQGLCHLMDQAVVLSGIRFDENFWLCGEDLDFSVFVAEKWRSVFVPTAYCWHLWGKPFSSAGSRNSSYLKRLSFIQNVTYMGYHRHYGKRLRGRYFDFLRGRGLWPTYRELFRDFGVNRHTIKDVCCVVYYAMVRREASNQQSARNLREYRRNYMATAPSSDC